MPATYASPGPRSTPALLALYVKVGACGLAVGADVRRIAVAGQLRDGRALVDGLLAADQLVRLATLAEVAALVVAVVLVLRWLVVVRANRAALAGGEPEAPDLRLRRLLRAWWVGLVVATLAVVASRVLLREATTVADRQRIDLLRAGATALSGVAAALTIAVVSTVTSRQERRAAERRVPEARRGPARAAFEGGLQVVSEEQARRRA